MPYDARINEPLHACPCLFNQKEKNALENASVWGPRADKSEHLIIGESQAEFNCRSELKVWSESGTSIKALWAQMCL